MMPLSSYEFIEVNWSQAINDIMSIREKVFIVEQRFAHDTLIDDTDPSSHHLLVRSSRGEAIACGRITPKGRIGRIAVLINHRGSGIGTMLLARLIKIAENKNIRHITINTETDLTHFYNQQKFLPDGPVYMKQGVPFQRMRMNLR